MTHQRTFPLPNRTNCSRIRTRHPLALLQERYPPVSLVDTVNVGNAGSRRWRGAQGCCSQQCRAIYGIRAGRRVMNSLNPQLTISCSYGYVKQNSKRFVGAANLQRFPFFWCQLVENVKNCQPARNTDIYLFLDTPAVTIPPKNNIHTYGLWTTGIVLVRSRFDRNPFKKRMLKFSQNQDYPNFLYGNLLPVFADVPVWKRNFVCLRRQTTWS